MFIQENFLVDVESLKNSVIVVLLFVVEDSIVHKLPGNVLCNLNMLYQLDGKV